MTENLKLYSCALIVQNNNKHGIIIFEPILLTASNENEATGMLDNYARENYLSSEGYNNYNYKVMEIKDNTLKNIYNLIFKPKLINGELTSES